MKQHSQKQTQTLLAARLLRTPGRRNQRDSARLWFGSRHGLASDGLELGLLHLQMIPRETAHTPPIVYAFLPPSAAGAPDESPALLMNTHSSDRL